MIVLWCEGQNIVQIWKRGSGVYANTEFVLLTIFPQLGSFAKLHILLGFSYTCLDIAPQIKDTEPW